ncbi:MAG: hypothetical protein II407_05295 [Prevotella sp.]|jgi:hypothetical protein|nr:hypothetical protein [Prevotella sp.]
MPFFSTLIPLACGCLLPIMIVWFFIRLKMNETNQRTRIVLAAIEKNPDMDLQEMMKKTSPKNKLLKEKLLSKLLWGCMTTLLGLVFIGMGAWLGYVGNTDPEDPITSSCFGFILLAIGIAFLINYFWGKKMLAKEMEAEEQLLTAQTEEK